jgi:hypothetical protein
VSEADVFPLPDCGGFVIPVKFFPPPPADLFFCWFLTKAKNAFTSVTLFAEHLTISISTSPLSSGTSRSPFA